jgi:hypothetical protein
MANEPDTPAPFSLRRWSQRKREAAREAAAPRAGEASSAPAPPAAPAGAAGAAVPGLAPSPTSVATSTSGAPLMSTPTAAAASAAAEPPLPPVDTLTIDSDFTPFMQPKVAEDVKRAALRKLFSDPQFNVMDGLDIYIGDYTQADPMPEGMLEKLGKVYGMLAKTDEPDAAADVSAEPAETPPSSAPAVAADASETTPVEGRPESAGSSELPADNRSTEMTPAVLAAQDASTSTR